MRPSPVIPTTSQPGAASAAWPSTAPAGISWWAKTTTSEGGVGPTRAATDATASPTPDSRGAHADAAKSRPRSRSCCRTPDIGSGAWALPRVTHAYAGSSAVAATWKGSVTMNRIASSAVRATLALAGALAVWVGSAGAARAEDPLFVPWTALLPGVAAPYDPADPNVCRAGKVQCVDATIREMQRRFDGLVTSCDHDAVFALAYLRTTQAYRVAVQDPAFFRDNGFVNHEDALFASMYFSAYDNWHAGRVDAVPRAWAIAFETARDRTDHAAGDLLLGMNAHVNRDLPIALYALGLVAPDGSSRKPDHDKVDLILNHVEGPIIAEIAQRLDPSIDDVNAPGTLD